jgi:1-acyl-sn-glycerol-3-phosphate acyltransferase
VEEIQAGFRGILRLIFAGLAIAAFFVTALFLKFKHRENHSVRRLAYAKNSQLYCGVMAKVFGVKIRVKGQPVQNSNFLYVGNHMGFVDIFVLASLFPALFITSQEMRETPFLGPICEMGGCVFVERRSRTKIINELKGLVDALKEGFNVVLYPEATSSNGEQVLPFKKTLMMSGPQAGRPIQPGCINFIEIDGEEFSLKNRDRVCWYGDMSFGQAMWGAMTAKSITAEVEFMEPIFVNPEADRSMVAERAYAVVKSRFNPAMPEKISDEAFGTAEES